MKRPRTHPQHQMLELSAAVEQVCEMPADHWEESWTALTTEDGMALNTVEFVPVSP